MKIRFTNKLAIMYFVVVALFFNTATSVMAFNGSLNSEQGFLVCTIKGYKWISASESNDSAPTQTQHCPICLLPASDDNLDNGVDHTPSYTAINSDNSLFTPSHRITHKTNVPYDFAQGRAPPRLTSPFVIS